MGQPFVGEVRPVPYNFAPVGWAFCQGQLMSIAEYTTLYQLIGTTYGGDGVNTFALPDLRGRVTLHQGNGYVIGQAAGTEVVTLTTQQLPQHNHGFLASGNTTAGVATPANNTVGASLEVYSNAAPSHALNTAMVKAVGGNQPHENLQPYLALNWIISLFGVYPAQG